MRRDTKNWLASADYDIETANHMLATARYLYVIFMCHLALEKTLKAIAAEAQRRTPPKTHDLLYLVNLGGVNLSREHLDFIGKINNASIPTRYPEDLAKAITAYPKGVSQSYLEKTKEVVEWLRQDPRLKRS
ncbi:HEPN domain-containing protein [bacterium]|nr:MAG: HEPN domain-containing protein [bacterium]